MEIKKDPVIIERILTKGVEQILPSKEALKEKLLSGERLTIYQGFDPSSPSLHIGHTVGMRKLEDLRKLGHRVIFLIGDFTARIGDPDKAQTRKMLTKEEVEDNMKVYVEQASPIIDLFNKENPVEIRYNSEWNEKLNFADVITLASELTVQQMLKRSLFQDRLQKDSPIHLNEFFYPLIQGYDSVAMNVDIEIGGNDQLFNMLVGREMVARHHNKEKIVITGKLLTTADGQKMGKTAGNAVSLDDTPENIYGKIMSTEDKQMLLSFELLTSATLEELEKYKERYESDENPMILKKELAFRITAELKSKEDAQKAEALFESVFQKKDVEIEIPVTKVEKEKLPLTELLVEIGFAQSKSNARRLVEQGAVKINDEKFESFNEEIDISKLAPFIIKAGKNITKITLLK